MAHMLWGCLSGTDKVSVTDSLVIWKGSVKFRN